jgi:Cof subfamily protein (haloacid dehalogenase superfamily)
VPTRHPLYITDLDGTLLRSDATLSGRSRTILNDALHQDVSFTIASARSVVAMQAILKGLDLTLPVIEFNGAFLSDFRTGEHLVTNSIDQAIVGEVYQQIRGAGCLPFLSTFDGEQDRLHYTEIVNAGMEWYAGDRARQDDRRLHQTNDLAAHLHEEVVCFTTIDREPVLLEMERGLNERHPGRLATRCFASIYSTGWYWLTVHDRRATKDRAIRRLTAEAGLAHRELVVFGDSDNDEPMFAIADRAIAMANASAELKTKADLVIGSNDEDSVALFVRDDARARG